MPWIIGGDWNFEPESIAEHWVTVLEAHVADTKRPSQKLGRNLDWYVASKRMFIRAIGTEVIPGKDHVGVTLTLWTSGHGTLGQRMQSPTPLPAEALTGVGSDGWEKRHASSSGAAPDTWDERTYQAEQGLLQTPGSKMVHFTGSALSGIARKRPLAGRTASTSSGRTGPCAAVR